MTDYLLKRAYDAEAPGDGYRVYIDRLWPRGLSHETFHYDLWDKGVAPSTELREWFHANPQDRWTDFEKKYRDEHSANPDFANLKAELALHKTVTLLYSSHDAEHNNAVVLKQCLEAS